MFGFTINAKTPNEQNPLELKDIKFNDARRERFGLFPHTLLFFGALMLRKDQNRAGIRT